MKSFGEMLNFFGKRLKKVVQKFWAPRFWSSGSASGAQHGMRLLVWVPPSWKAPSYSWLTLPCGYCASLSTGAPSPYFSSRRSRSGCYCQPTCECFSHTIACLLAYLCTCIVNIWWWELNLTDFSLFNFKLFNCISSCLINPGCLMILLTEINL